MLDVLPLDTQMRLSVGLILLAAACDSEPGVRLPYNTEGRPVLPFPTDAVTVPANTPTGHRLNLGEQGSNLGDVDEAMFLLGDEFVTSLNELDGWSTLGPVFLPLSDDAPPDSEILLIDLGEQAVIPVQSSVIDGKTEYGKDVHWITAKAAEALRPAARHAIVAMRGLETTSGQRFERPETFDPNLDRLAGLAEALDANGLSIDDVLVADTYTTLSIYEETEALASAMRSEPAPVVTVTDVSDAVEMEHIAKRLYATFEMPLFRDGLDGPMIVDADGAVRQGSELVEMVVYVPEGQGPFPVVIFGHGVGSHKEQMNPYADGMAAGGVALVSIDWPLHGFRTDRPGNAGTRFLNITKPESILDNFRQGETDQVYLVRAIDALAEMDPFGDGTALDTARLFYVGESLGGIIGGAVMGIEPRIEGGVLLVAGGTLLEFFDRVLSGFQFDGFPTSLFTTVAQTSLDRGDPTNFARRATDKQVLLIQAMNDNTVPAGASYALSVAMGLPQVSPVFERAPEVAEVGGEVERRGWVQIRDGTHSLMHAEEQPGYEEARQILFGFIASWAATGTGVIKRE